ncbi:MAG: hypothetical protein RR575_00030 [Acinetobacter sp.]
MRHIDFSDVGVVVNSMEELDELYITYSALGITFSDVFVERCIEAQEHNLEDYYIQSTRGDLKAELDGDYLTLAIIKYPIEYTMDKLDFAVAYHLLKSNQTDELKAHLDKYCKEYK